ncbi:hypothetical protein [Paenibacillus albus]|nr:hypothetical protein [Paenibacillus albus]
MVELTEESGANGLTGAERDGSQRELKSANGHQTPYLEQMARF